MVSLIFRYITLFELTISFCLIEVAHSTTEYMVDGLLLDAKELNVAAVVVIEELKEGMARVDGNITWCATPGNGKDMAEEGEKRETEGNIYN